MSFTAGRYDTWGSPDRHVEALSKLFKTSCVYGQFNAIVTLTFILLLLFNHTAMAADGYLNLTAGAEYTSGDYGGSESIDEWYLPFTGRYTTDRYTFRLTIPYLRVTAPEGTLSGTTLPDTGARITEDGLGDIIAGVTYRDALNTDISSDVTLDFTAKVKFGTADETRGLGTGENDYTVQAELYKYLYQFTPYAILGYKFRGDPPGINLQDSCLTLVGGNFRVTQALTAGMDYYFRQASLTGLDDHKELTAFFGYKLSSTQYLRGYLIKGFGDASPDWGAGFLISFKQ